MGNFAHSTMKPNFPTVDQLPIVNDVMPLMKTMLTSNDTTKMSHSSVSSRSLPVSENGPNDTLLNAKFNPADRSTVPTNGSTFSVKNTSPANSNRLNSS